MCVIASNNTRDGIIVRTIYLIMNSFEVVFFVNYLLYNVLASPQRTQKKRGFRLKPITCEASCVMILPLEETVSLRRFQKKG